MKHIFFLKNVVTFDAKFKGSKILPDRQKTIPYLIKIKNIYLSNYKKVSCTPTSCLNGGTCVATSSSPFHQCICPIGYTGETCSTCKKKLFYQKKYFLTILYNDFKSILCQFEL